MKRQLYLAKDINWWVVHLDRVKNASFLVDFEEAEYDGADLDGPIESAGK